MELTIQEIEALKKSIDFAIKETALVQFLLVMCPMPNIGLTVEQVLGMASTLSTARDAVSKLNKE